MPRKPLTLGRGISSWKREPHLDKRFPAAARRGLVTRRTSLSV